MKRTQIQIKDDTYEQLRKRAFEENTSIAAVIRDILDDSLGTKRPKLFRLKDLHFVGIGSSEPSEYDPISERHDEFLGDELYREIVEKARAPKSE